MRLGLFRTLPLWCIRLGFNMAVSWSGTLYGTRHRRRLSCLKPIQWWQLLVELNSLGYCGGKLYTVCWRHLSLEDCDGFIHCIIERATVLQNNLQIHIQQVLCRLVCLTFVRNIWNIVHRLRFEKCKHAIGQHMTHILMPKHVNLCNKLWYTFLLFFLPLILFSFANVAVK